MTAKKPLLPILIMIWAVAMLATAGAAEVELQNKDVPRITAAELQQLQTREAVTIIDTRRPDQWQQATDKIPGAIRVTTYAQLFDLKKIIKTDSAIVTYCT